MKTWDPDDGKYLCKAERAGEEHARITNARLGNVFEFINMHEGGLNGFEPEKTTTRYVICVGMDSDSDDEGVEEQ